MKKTKKETKKKGEKKTPKKGKSVMFGYKLINKSSTLYRENSKGNPTLAGRVMNVEDEEESLTFIELHEHKTKVGKGDNEKTVKIPGALLCYASFEEAQKDLESKNVFLVDRPKTEKKDKKGTEVIDLF